MDRNVAPPYFPINQDLLPTALILGLIAFICSIAVSHDIFILNEGRTYFVNDGFVDKIGLWNYWLYPTGSNTRYTSMYFADFVGKTCGVGRICTNVLESVLVALQVLVIYVHTSQIIQSTWRSVSVTLLWALSGAALSGIVWQSIQHDKIAVILIIATTIVILEFFSKERVNIGISILFSLLFVFLFGISFNAKEIAFFLPLILGGVAVLFGLRSRRTFIQNVVVATPALLYSAFYIFYYYHNLDRGWAAHIAGGDWKSGFVRLVLNSLNLGTYFELPQLSSAHASAISVAGTLYILWFAGIFVFAGYLITHAIFVRRFRLSLAYFMTDWWRELYVCSIIFIFLIVFSRSASPSPFYIMLPVWALLCFIVLNLERMALFTSFPREFVYFGLLTFAFPWLVAYSTFYENDGVVIRLARNSGNLENTAATLRMLVKSALVKRIILVTEGSPDADWYLLHGARSDDFDQDLPAYLFQNKDFHPVTLRLSSEAIKANKSAPGDLVVVIDQNYCLRKLLLDDKALMGGGFEANAGR